MLNTFGETVLRLEPPAGERLSTARNYRVGAGGREAAAAVAARRAGVEATHTTVLPATSLGERAAADLRDRDVTLRVHEAEGRQGLTFRDPAVAPAPETRIEDRTRTALAGLDPEAVAVGESTGEDGAYVTAETVGASTDAAKVAARFLASAGEAGATTAFGLFYRGDQWDPEEARENVTACFPAADTLIASESAVATVLGRDGEPRQVAHALASEHDLACVALVRDRTLLAWHDATVYETDTLDTETVDPAGAADAFAGTFLARLLAGDGHERALTYGTAAHALARTTTGPLAAYSREDLDSVAGVET